MLIENKCVSLHMNSDDDKCLSFFFFPLKFSGVHLSLLTEWWTSCKCLCNLWSQPEARLCFSWSLSWEWSPEKGRFEGLQPPWQWGWVNVTPQTSHSHAKSHGSLLPGGKGWPSPNATWGLSHMALVHSVSFELLLHPAGRFTFPWTLCVFAEIVFSTEMPLQFTPVRWTHPSVSSSIVSSSGKPRFLLWHARSLYSQSVTSTPLRERVFQGILNTYLLI